MASVGIACHSVTKVLLTKFPWDIDLAYFVRNLAILF